jgi:hypothetical protein
MFLLGIGQEPDSPAALRLLPDAGRWVPLDLLVVLADPEDQGECSLPAVPGSGGPFTLPRLFRQPLHDFILADGIGRAGPEFGAKLIDTQAEFVGLLFAVLGATVFERIVTQIIECDRAGAEQLGLLLAKNDLLPTFVQASHYSIEGDRLLSGLIASAIEFSSFTTP